MKNILLVLLTTSVIALATTPSLAQFGVGVDSITVETPVGSVTDTTYQVWKFVPLTTDHPVFTRTDGVDSAGFITITGGPYGIVIHFAPQSVGQARFVIQCKVICGTIHADYDSTRGTLIVSLIARAAPLNVIPNRVTSSADSLVLFPNPASHSVMLRNVKGAAISITDYLGRAYNLPTHIFGSNQKIDVSSLTNGIYFLSQLTARGLVTAKFEIAR